MTATQLDRERRALPSALIALAVTWFVVIFVLLVACNSSPRGTVTEVNRLPSGEYQLEVIDQPGGTGNARDNTYRLVDAGPSTGCQVGEQWPSCDEED